MVKRAIFIGLLMGSLSTAAMAQEALETDTIVRFFRDDR